MVTAKQPKLPTIFKKWGFTHTLLQQKGLNAIYKKTKRKSIGYEVMVFKEHGAYTLGGINFPAGIAMPSNEMWGQRGWSYALLADAEKRFKKL